MENAIVVNQQELTIKEYQGKRVVSLYNIAKLHGTDSDHIRKSFERNIKHLIENEDYFVLDKEDNFVATFCRKEMRPQAFNRIKNIPVFTESGYLMITKSLTDDLSWQVQRQLVNCYFKVKEVVKEAVEKEVKPELVSLADVNKTIELLTSMYDSMKVPNEDKLNTVKSLLKTAGLSIPDIELPSKIDKSDYISIEEVAKRVGLYDKYSRINIEAAMITLGNIGIVHTEYNVIVNTDGNNNATYGVFYTPKIVTKISDYLKKENYPQFLERELSSGDIRRVLVVYKDKDFHIHKK